jgi:hypothetical protein
MLSIWDYRFEMGRSYRLSERFLRLAAARGKPHYRKQKSFTLLQRWLDPQIGRLSPAIVEYAIAV